MKSHTVVLPNGCCWLWAILFVIVIQKMPSCQSVDEGMKVMPGTSAALSHAEPRGNNNDRRRAAAALSTASSHPVARQSHQHPHQHPQHMCEYKEILTKLHDRFSMLATLDEDLRSRLTDIERKIDHFEASNMARMESLGAQQMDFNKHVGSLEQLQHLTKRDVEELKEIANSRVTRQAPGNWDRSLFDYNERTIFNTNGNFIAGNTNNNNNHPNIGQPQRIPPPQLGASSPIPSTESGPGSVNISTKLDALAILLTSNIQQLASLEQQIRSNLTRLTNVQRRTLNMHRRQQGSLGNYPGRSAVNGADHLVTSCAQGAPLVNGILKLQLEPSSAPFYVSCDEQQIGGGWTVILNRFNGDVNFDRDWLEYRSGFGNLAGEFFIGLDKLHALTTAALHELLVVLENFGNIRSYARYSLFAIGGESEAYALKLLGSYEGTAGDSFSYHAGSKFSTFDNDNDGCVDCNCAHAHTGGWWYDLCEQSHLTGKYYKANETIADYTGMYWHTFMGSKQSLMSAKMMIRPVDNDPERRR